MGPAPPLECPLDAPRPTSNEHWDFVATLSVSSLYLSTNQTYRGYSLLVFDPRHVLRLDQLTPEEWMAYSADLRVAHDALVDAVHPDHMNVELLGNVTPHLHWHLVPRRRDDPRWGGPIWTTSTSEMQQTHLSPDERHSLLAQIKQSIAARLG